MSINRAKYLLFIITCITLERIWIANGMNHFKCSTQCECYDIRANCSNVPNLKIPVTALSPKFHYLYFNNIGLKTITDDTFSSYINMTTLHLSHNSISSISENAFKQNVNLTRIYIDHNMLSSLPENVFRYNLKLDELQLSYNSLQRIEANHFKYLTALTTIFLNNNRLVFIDDEAFANLNKLNRLFLENNDLKTANKSWLAHFDHVDDPKYEMYLDNNPWSCDCRMKNFMHWSKTQKWFSEDNNDAGVAFPVCAQPASLKGRRWTSLTEKDFICDRMRSVEPPRMIELDYGEYLNISCNATGLPIPTINITRDGITKAFSDKGHASFNVSATPAHSGKYECLISGTTSHGNPTDKIYYITVNVHKAPVNPFVIILVLLIIGVAAFSGVWIYKKKYSKTARYNSLPDSSIYYEGGHADQEQSATLMNSTPSDAQYQETNDDEVMYSKDSEKEVLV